MKIKKYLGTLVLAAFIAVMPISALADEVPENLENETTENTTVEVEDVYNITLDGSIKLEGLNKTIPLGNFSSQNSNLSKEEFNQFIQTDNIYNYILYNRLVYSDFQIEKNDISISTDETGTEIQTIDEKMVNVHNYTVTVTVTKVMKTETAADKNVSIDLTNGQSKTYTVSEDNYKPLENIGQLLEYLIYDYYFFEDADYILGLTELNEDGVYSYYFKIVSGKLVSVSNTGDALLKVSFWDIDDDNYCIKVEALKSSDTQQNESLNYDDVVIIVKEALVEDEAGEFYLDLLNSTYAVIDVNIDIAYGDSINYEFLEGENQDVNVLDEDDTLSFRIDADYSLFLQNGKVYVDDNLVDSKYYTSKSGSTIITFVKEFLDTLAAGNHTLRVDFGNGMASTNFTVSRRAVAAKNTASNTTTTVTSNPKTFDNVILYLLIVILSLVGIAGSATILKRQFN